MLKVQKRFEIFTVVKIKIVVFCVMTPSTVVGGYWHFRGISCTSVQGDEGSRFLQNVGKN
jgi:hypothetical protein